MQQPLPEPDTAQPGLRPLPPPPLAPVSPDGNWQWNGMRWVPRVQMVVAIEPVRPKDKTAAVLLAVFLAQWTWLYTYRRDAALFWGNLIAIFLTGGGWLVVAWPWAIIHTCVRPDSFYRQFPNG